MSASLQEQSGATKGHIVGRIKTGLVCVVSTEGFLVPIPTDLVGKKLMTETIVDQRGRVLIPEEIRESAGLTSGAMVAIEKAKDVVVIKRLRKHKRGWRQLCGLAPERTGKPEWPSTEEIKDIWR
jgi:bifunctional DNA-binding transcriptional regulator/antitoxin component of YhaV-PrlF toxin-antitoxin module